MASLAALWPPDGAQTAPRTQQDGFNSSIIVVQIQLCSSIHCEGHGSISELDIYLDSFDCCVIPSADEDNRFRVRLLVLFRCAS